MKLYCVTLILLIVSLELITGRYIDGRKERRTRGSHARNHRKLLETTGLKRSQLDTGTHARRHRKLVDTNGIKRSQLQTVNGTLNVQNIPDDAGKNTKSTIVTKDHAKGGERKSKVESDEQRDDDKEARTRGTDEEREKGRGMSAIVVIGNRTHRVSGPVVKQLLFELEHQNEEEKPKLVETVAPKEVDAPPAVNLRRLYAANEVAEINKLLGKPLTDAKALGLIKNLLLDKVHTHLAKTMENESGPRIQGESGSHFTQDNGHTLVQSNGNFRAESESQSPLAPPANPDFGFAARKHATHSETCKDIDPKDKCQYLKDLGLCVEGEKHPEVRRRCQETCGLCEWCVDCIPQVAANTEPLPPLPLPQPEPEPRPEPRPNIPLPASPPAPPSPPLPPQPQVTLPPPLPATLPTPQLTHIHKVDHTICKETPCDVHLCKEPPCAMKEPCKETPCNKVHACNDEKDPSCLIVIQEERFEKPCKDNPPCCEMHEVHENKCKDHPCNAMHDGHDNASKEHPCNDLHELHENPCKDHPCYEVHEIHESPCKEHPCYVVHETHESHETTCKEKERPCYDPKEVPCKEHPCDEGHDTPCKEHPCDPTSKHQHQITTLQAFLHPSLSPTVPRSTHLLPVAISEDLTNIHHHLVTSIPAVLRPSRQPPVVLHDTHDIHMLPTTTPPGCAESLLDPMLRPNICPQSLMVRPTPEVMLDPESTIHPLLTNLPPTPTLSAIGQSTVIMGTKFMATNHAHHIHPTMAHPHSVDIMEPQGSTSAVITPNGICQLPMEIGIAIDTSAAMVPHWQQMLYFVKSLVDKFQMGSVSRIGIITFDTIAKIPIHLEKYKDTESLKQHLDKLFADPYGRRRTDAALEIAKTTFFAKGRPGVPKVLFIVEHGRINGGDPSINWEDLLLDPAERLREMGVNIFAVGATPIVTPEELKIITGDWSHVVPLQSYSQLQGIVPQLAIKACKLAGIVRRSKNPKISLH